MSRVTVLCGLLAIAGCAPLPGRSQDFARCWRIDVDLGLGAYAGVNVGDAAHLGVGFTAGARIGEAYGHVEGGSTYCNLGILFLHSQAFHKGGWDITPDNPDCPGCAAVVPGLYNGHPRSTLHHADIELTLFAGIFGIEIGFSPGEFVNWIAGFFGTNFDPVPEGEDSKSTLP